MRSQNHALCDSMLITQDTAIFPGELVTLQGHGMFQYNWFPYFPNQHDSVQLVAPTQTTTYYLTGYYLDTNIVYNGDFNLGNTGFTSNYTNNQSSVWNEGTYAIGTNSYTYHSSFPSLNDHTTGHGNYMIVNGATNTNQPVWTQTISVVPNTDYVFTTWTITFCVPVADLQFSINGQQIGNIFQSPVQLGVWQQFYQIWNSGNSTQAVITILNQNTTAGGNDFGLDDISFCPLYPCMDSVTVEVLMPLMARNDTIVGCAGDTVTFYPTANDSIDYRCGMVYPLVELPPMHSGHISWHDFAFTINFLDDFNGIDSVTYVICCGEQCDTATIYLIVSGKHETFIDTICAGTPYHLHGFDLSEEQTLSPGFAYFIDSARTVWGCDSITELYLQINSQPYVEVDYFGCDSLLWNDELILESGDYRQAFVTAHNCDSIVVAHVTIKHDTIMFDNIFEDFCLNEMTYLLANTDLDNLKWSTDASSPIILIEEPGTYWVSAGDSACFASDTIVIDACCPDAGYQIPNVITPSTPDGFNDVFLLPDDFTPFVLEIKIYDRWGKKVFQSEDPSFQWDGSVNGHIAPGVYYYNLLMNHQCAFNGSITVF